MLDARRRRRRGAGADPRVPGALPPRLAPERRRAPGGQGVKLAFAAAVAALLLVASRDARAAVPVALDLSGCPEIAPAPVERLVAIELRATVVPARDQVTRVAARCGDPGDGRGAAELEV